MTTPPKAPEPELQALALQLSEVEQRMATRDGHVANDVNRLLNSILLIEQRLAGIEAFISGRLANTDNLVGNLAEITLALGPDLSAIRGMISQSESHLANLAKVTSTTASSVSTKIEGAISKSDNHFANVSQATSDINVRISSLTGQLANADNRIESLTAMAVANAARISEIQGAVANIANRLANMTDASHREGLALLLARGAAALATRDRSDKAIRTTQPLSAPALDVQMAAMRKAAPLNFDAWKSAYNIGISEGRRTVEGNLSHEGHPGATYFRMFVNIHAKGTLLDVGCGPLAVPAYLTDYPPQEVAGIDPQPPFDEPHPFPFAVSFAEYIPWPDSSFETVVIGTSLDHVYLLDKALSEVKRVLAPRGRLLLWTAMFDETKPYDPYRATIVQPDTYHLFHPGRNWFYELLASDYRLIERMAVPGNAEFLAFQRK